MGNDNMDKVREMLGEIRTMVADFFSKLQKWSGFDRFRRDKSAYATGRSGIGKVLYYLRPAVAGFFIIYVALLFIRFTIIHGDDLEYPQRAMSDEEFVVPPGTRIPNPQPGGPICEPSQVVAVTAYIIDVLVNQNVWVPGDPQYKIGFGFVGFAETPWFDNKAHFQTGALRAARRISIELVDLLGRARGTSASDPDLEDARSALQWSERAWIFNPFDDRLQTISASASQSYRSAKNRLLKYNDRLANCSAVFDSRGDNLFLLLDRIANDIGGLTDELASRAKGIRWSVEEQRLVRGEGNNRWMFDFRADDLFWRAHGMMWAYHGILQAMRIDFGDVVRSANLTRIWDRMEIHVAEAASLKPLIVSNGREDSMFMPDHLSIMAANMLRAHANTQELREVINR
ncbi:MAG: DUF2333 family protein [Rhodobacteraceae bacterium]|nr:MAG: DUF2333 family protein [Paracoccaceae bacterium]